MATGAQAATERAQRGPAGARDCEGTRWRWKKTLTPQHPVLEHLGGGCLILMNEREKGEGSCCQTRNLEGNWKGPGLLQAAEAPSLIHCVHKARARLRTCKYEYRLAGRWTGDCQWGRPLALPLQSSTPYVFLPSSRLGLPQQSLRVIPALPCTLHTKMTPTPTSTSIASNWAQGWRERGVHTGVACGRCPLHFATLLSEPSLA